MKPLLKTLFVLFLASAAGGVAIWYYTTSTTQVAYDKAITQLQQQWTERLGRIRGVEDPELYQDEVRAGLKWYFSELQKVHNRFPDLKNLDRAWTEIEEQHRAGHIPSNKMETYEEFFQLVKAAYELLERGEYAPKINAMSSSLHLDIYSIERDQIEGVPRLKIDFMLWGAPRRIKVKTLEGGTKVKKVVVPLRFSRMFFQFINESGKVHGEMMGNTGEPTIKIIHPERWIREFPAQAVLGTWWVELFPPEAHSVVWEIGLSGRTDAGNPIEALFKWEFPVPEAWKTTGDWGGTEQVMPEDYINRKE